MMAFAVLGQHVADVETWELQHIAKVLLILIAIQPAQRATTMCKDFGVIHRMYRAGKRPHQRGALLRRQILGLRRHLAFLDPVMDADPTLAGRVIGQIKLQRGEIETALSGFLVMALDAALLDLWRHRLRLHHRDGEDAEDGEEALHRFTLRHSLR
jgi:hypothetical protein